MVSKVPAILCLCVPSAISQEKELEFLKLLEKGKISLHAFISAVLRLSCELCSIAIIIIYALAAIIRAYKMVNLAKGTSVLLWFPPTEQKSLQLCKKSRYLAIIALSKNYVAIWGKSLEIFIFFLFFQQTISKSAVDILRFSPNPQKKAATRCGFFLSMRWYFRFRGSQARRMRK